MTGAGPVDLVLTPGFISHLDLQWESVAYRRFVRQLAVGFMTLGPLQLLGTQVLCAFDPGLMLELIESERRSSPEAPPRWSRC